MVYIILPQFLERYNFAGSNRVLNYSKGLITNGLNCKIITFSRILYEAKDSKDNYEGVPFINLQTKSESQNLFLRLFGKFQIRRKLYLYLKENINNDDIVISYYYDLLISLFVYNLVKRLRFKVIMELNEIPYYDNKFLNRINRWLELNFFFKMYDGFIVISENLSILAEKYKSKKSKIIKIPILINVSKKYETTTSNLNNPYIFNAGTMVDFKDGIFGILIGFGLAQKRLPYTIDYIFVGPKSINQKGINKIIKEYNLSERVKFIQDPISSEELNNYYYNCSLSIINKNDNIQNNYCFPSKLGEILLSKTALITTTIGEANNFLENDISAYIVEPGNPTLIADKIVDAFTDIEKRNRIAMQGYNIAINEFNYYKQGKRLVEFLNTLFL